MAEASDKKVSKLRFTCRSQYEDDDGYASTTFTIFDIIRMLVGLILAWYISTSFVGHWFYTSGGDSSKRTDGTSPEIPKYFADQELPIGFTIDQLSKYSEEGETGIILLSVKGHVFDVSKSESFYGKWGVYKKFAGTDCSNLFGCYIWDLSALGRKCNHDLSNLSESEMERVDSWLAYFTRKYPEIGYLKVP